MQIHDPKIKLLKVKKKARQETWQDKLPWWIPRIRVNVYLNYWGKVGLLVSTFATVFGLGLWLLL